MGRGNVAVSRAREGSNDASSQAGKSFFRIWQAARLANRLLLENCYDALNLTDVSRAAIGVLGTVVGKANQLVYSPKAGTVWFNEDMLGMPPYLDAEVSEQEITKPGFHVYKLSSDKLVSSGWFS